MLDAQKGSMVFNFDRMEFAIKELINLIAKSLADYPGNVEISEIDGATTTVIELKVAK